MQQRIEKEWELSIDPDTVRLFILKAKALSAAVKQRYAEAPLRAPEPRALGGDAQITPERQLQAACQAPSGYGRDGGLG